MTTTHTFKPGDVLVATWGYSMTIVDFYRVEVVTDTMVRLTHFPNKHVKQGAICPGVRRA